MIFFGLNMGWRAQDILWLVLRKYKRNNYNGTNNIKRFKDLSRKEATTFFSIVGREVEDDFQANSNKY
jgi:hypothetical protein